MSKRVSNDHDMTTTNKKPDPDIAYIAESLRNLGEIAAVFQQLLPSLTSLAIISADRQERIEDIPEQLDKINSGLENISSILRQEDQVKKATNGLQKEIQQTVIDSIQRRIKRQVENQNKLLERVARYGVNPPIELENEISDIEEKIDDLKIKLKVEQDKDND